MVTGGMIALGAEGSNDKEKYLKLGGEIARTCHEAYDRSGKLIHCALPEVLYTLVDIYTKSIHIQYMACFILIFYMIIVCCFVSQ